MKPRPSIKERKRYIVIKVESKSKFSSKDISIALNKNFEETFGIIFLSKASIDILANRSNEENQTMLVKVGHKYVDDLKASLTFLKKINGKVVIVRSVISSGTLKKALAKV